MARLYSNENFPIPIVEELRRLGHDVVSIQERGRANEGVPDPDVLQMAAQEGRAVLTLNRKDFIRLHKQGQVHEGIVACTADADFVGQANRIHEAIFTLPTLTGQLVRINRPQK